MCGIMGYVGEQPVVDVLIRGLKRLEYRGYDSAGVAFFRDRLIEVHKSEGKITNVERILKDIAPPKIQCGVGHTRWATHGKPTTQNAHPHRTGHVVLVHNGIIENYLDIKNALAERGYVPQSETDSELFGFLVLEEMETGLGLVDAVRKSFMKLEGACSVVVMSEKEPGVIVGVRNGSPLVVAHSPEKGFLVASDAQPLLEYTREVVFLENGDLCVGKEDSMEFFDLWTGKPQSRPRSVLDWSVDSMDKQGFPHYMLKEIHEQPQSFVDTLNGILDRAKADPFPLAQQPGVDILKKAEELILIACGTSWHAALVGKYWLERWAGISVSVELASEFRYRDPVLRRNSVVVGISQSGETADTLAVIREVRRRGIPTLALTNVRGSTLAREATATFYTSAGPEIGVASTKSFTTQLLCLLSWAGFLGLQRGQDTALRVPPLFEEVLKLPHQLSTALQPGTEFTKSIHEAAKRFQQSKGFFFIGRGYSYPIAMEGALKLKEIAYVHAEGYAAGELKHGPIAMIDQEMVVVALAPRDQWYDKTISNLQEVKARGAKVIGIGHADDIRLKEQSESFIPLPFLFQKSGSNTDESLYPFFLTPVMQLLSYEIAVMKGTDVDQPRNLAKSVTVE